MLTNKQFDQLYKEYENLQNNSRKLLQQRRLEINDAIPEYSLLLKELKDLTETFAQNLNGSDNNIILYKDKLARISRDKQNLLIRYGYPPDYLEPQYECNICKDTGYTDSGKCICFQQKIIDFVYDQTHIRSHLEKNNFSHLSDKFYQGDDLIQFNKALDTSKQFINNFDKAFTNLLIYGNVGVGKTFLSGCIAKELLDQCHTVIYLGAEKLNEVFSKKINNNKNNLETIYLPNPEDLVSCDLLIIDDLGTETINSFTISNLFSLLNERIIRQKPVIITTNLTLNSIRDLYSERISSRLFSEYKLLKITGPDIRIIKKNVIK